MLPRHAPEKTPSDINATRLPFHCLNACKKKLYENTQQVLIRCSYSWSEIRQACSPQLTLGGVVTQVGSLPSFLLVKNLHAPFFPWQERWSLVFVRQESIRYFCKTYTYKCTGMFPFFWLCMRMKVNIFCLLLQGWLINTSFHSLVAPDKLWRPETSLGGGTFA